MQDLNLRVMESKAWRANQQDGLFDLFFAVIVLGIALSEIADGLWHNEAATLGMLVFIQFGGAAGLWWARRHITQPRLGVVHFAPARKRRTRTTSIVLALCVAATLALVLLTSLHGGGHVASSKPVSRMTVSVIVAAVVLIPLAAIAYFQEFPRILVHAVFFLGAEFGGTWLEQETTLPFPRAVTFGAAAMVSAAVGFVILRKFLKAPVPTPGGTLKEGS